MPLHEHVRILKNFVKEKRFDDANRAYEEMLRNYTNNPEVLDWGFRLAVAQGDIRLLEDRCIEALKRHQSVALISYIKRYVHTVVPEDGLRRILSEIGHIAQKKRGNYHLAQLLISIEHRLQDYKGVLERYETTPKRPTHRPKQIVIDAAIAENRPDIALGATHALVEKEIYDYLRDAYTLIAFGRFDEASGQITEAYAQFKRQISEKTVSEKDSKKFMQTLRNFASAGLLISDYQECYRLIQSCFQLDTKTLYELSLVRPIKTPKQLKIDIVAEASSQMVGRG
ncbi:MAG: hypothetical protein KGJ06_04790 [Pseudomonadota bacterium]|nr:hypothetical protein [Pseudomonadota bacterium]